MKNFLLIGFSILGLILLLMGSIWVAGPHLFALDNYKNILFISPEIDSSKSKIYLAYFFPNTNEITLSMIESAPVSVLGGYGDYELNKVYPLLEIEKKKPDFRLSAMSWGTETIVDQIIEIDDEAELKTKKQLQQQLWQGAINRIVNPSQAVELLKAFFFTKSIPVEQLAINQEPTLVKELNVLNNVILYEDCLVAVVNTTEEVGLASKISTIIEKNGAVVIRITDQNSPYQLSTFSFDPDNNSCQSLSERLRVLFPGQIIKQHQAQLQHEYRADLIIFIGKDFLNLI